MKLTFKQMWCVCDAGLPPAYADYFGHNDDAKAWEIISQEKYAWLKKHEDEIKIVCCSFSMSENHPGGDEICEYVQSAIEAEREGYKVQVWYGDESEVLIVGIREGSEIELYDHPIHENG